MCKGFTLPLVILLLFLVLLTGVYFLTTKGSSLRLKQTEKSELTSDTKIVPLELRPEFKSIVNIANSDTTNCKTYTDPKTKVSFKYPQKYLYSPIFYER